MRRSPEDRPENISGDGDLDAQIERVLNERRVSFSVDDGSL